MRLGSAGLSRLRKLAVGAAVVAISASAAIPSASAGPPRPADEKKSATARSDAHVTRDIPTSQRTLVLGGKWRSKPDRAVVAVGDGSGFHVMVGDSADGYAWRTVASLSEPGVETDQWIGNVCVTGSGDRAVVVYAPRHFANRAYLADRGAFTAVVNLRSGAVRKLPVTSSLAYFNPGCGAGESAVLTQGGGDDLNKTRLMRVSAKSGRLGRAIVVKGQVSSPVPTARGIIAAANGALVRVLPTGQRTVVAEARGVPYRLAADENGGVVFLQRVSDERAQARRVSLRAPGAKPQPVAVGELTEIGVASGRGGQVFITGAAQRAGGGQLPPSVHMANVGRDATMSLNGSVAVSKVNTPTRLPRNLTPDSPADTAPVDITATAVATGKEFALTAVPAPLGGDGATLSPALADAAVAGDPTDPSDDALRTCAIPRNDPRNQPMQPKPRQVEWTVNELANSRLNVFRPANWKNLGMDAYNVTEMFPERQLAGGGRAPMQILLGIALAESNLSQSAWYAVPGVTANPLIGNYYGVGNRGDPLERWAIDFSKADCGYGVMQITDGMRKAGSERPQDAPALPYAKQRAVALDFAANIAEGERILASKWNATRADGLKLNQGQTWALENWFYALWAYNSGYYPRASAGNNAGAWGVGWFNNPINPRYDIGRPSFLYNAPEHGRTPQEWPYPERVLGYAASPPWLIESPGVTAVAYRPASWTTESNKINVKPPVGLFCEIDVNSCSETKARQKLEPCLRSDFRCWFNQPATWKPDCDSECGQEYERFGPEQYPYQADGTAYAPNCSLAGLPSGALIVDNVSTSVPSIRPDCPKSFTNSGSFDWWFAESADGRHVSKVDVHQLGTGFGGHFWMSNTTASRPNLRATGTWTFNRGAGQWARVLVHLPVVGARTQQAKYEIDVAGDLTFSKKRYIPQEIQRNGWVSLGVVKFSGTPRIRLSNITEDGRGTERIAWDAIALQPLPSKPKHFVAALGDSYSSGEGSGSYYPETNTNHGTHRWNACRRGKYSWPRLVVLPGSDDALGTKVDAFDPNYELGFVACSGADTANVRGIDFYGESWHPPSWDHPEEYQDGNGQFHEVAQIESGVLDVNTTLVTFTLGGNDEHAFTEAIQECNELGPSCGDDPEFLPKYKRLIDKMKPRLKSVVREIREKAPNAHIVLLGYPEIFSRSAVDDTCPESVFIDSDGAAALAKLADHVDLREEEIRLELEDEGLTMYQTDPIEEFVGHGVCDDGAWINGVVVGPSGEGDYHPGDKDSLPCLAPFNHGVCVSRDTFHPNSRGAVQYAHILGDYLDAIEYNGG